MSSKMAKKIRRAVKRNWMAYLQDIKVLPFWNRVGLAWWIVFGREKVRS